MHSHIALLAGFKSSGEPVLEQVPAEHLEGPRYRLAATPGLAFGCADGDVVEVADDGSFEVLVRGGNLGLLFYGPGVTEVVEPLGNAFRGIGGQTEAPEDAEFIVATVPMSVGFDSVENAIRDGLSGRPGVGWFYSNVYDEQDQPLNWLPTGT